MSDDLTPRPRLSRDAEVSLMARVFAQHAARTTTLAPEGTRVPAVRYVSIDHYQREQATVFRHEPVFAGLSVDIADPGDRLVLHSGGVPIVVTRTSSGDLRAYVNVCRHRGAPLVRGCESGARTFVCPFHGWVYDTADGRLLGQPRSCDGFTDVSPYELALLPVAVAEAYGIVVVRPGGPATIDIDAWLGGLQADLVGLGYRGVRPFKAAQTTWNCNWKLLIDTFLESYHVPSLHRESLGAAYIGAASPFDAFGVHNRIVVPQAAILDQEPSPRETWDLLQASVLQYFLAPNVIISNLLGYVMTWRFVPDAVDRTTVEHRLYTYEEVESDERRTHFEARFEAARNVTSNEDFPESERIHANLASGMLDASVIGRNEPGVVHFHEMIREATAI